MMIGILLALQVDEWRDFRDKQEKEIQLIKLLIQDLKYDRTQLEIFEKNLKEQREGVIKFMSSIEHESPHDSILKYASRGLGGYIYRPIYPTYEGLKLSGSLELISKPDIRNLIIQYHEQKMEYLKELKEGYRSGNQRAREAFEPYLGYRYSEGQWEAIGTFQVEDLRSDIRAKNLLSTAGIRRNGLIRRINQLFYPANQILTDSLTDYLDKIQ